MAPEQEYKYTDYLQIPGWDDIVHIKPRPQITEEQIKEHRRRLKAHEATNLSRDQQQELQKRRERYLRIKKSPTPEIVRSISTIMTALDDAEDALVTSVVIGRLLVKLLPRIMGRFIPYLGWALLTADIINLFQILSWLPFNPMSAKRTKEGLTDRNPFGRAARLTRVTRIGRIIPTIGETLEVAQTTDQLFGVGVCLGSIMGFVQDCAFGLYRDIKQYGWRSAFELPNKLFFNNMRGAAIAYQCEQELTDQEHTNLMVSTHMAQSALKGTLNNMNWYESAKEYAQVPIGPPAVYDPTTRFILEDAHEDIEATTRWPLAGNPEKVSLARFAEEGFKRINESLKGYVDRMKKTYEGYVASDCLHEQLYDTLLLWEGHNQYSHAFYERKSKRSSISLNIPLGGLSLSNPIPSFSPGETADANKEILKKSMTPFESITMQLLEYGILPQPKDDPDKIFNMIQRVAGGQKYYETKYTKKELYDTWKSHIGTPRDYFPIYPRMTAKGFLTHPDEWTEDFRKNMSSRCEMLWPNWELAPKECLDFYISYGLL